MAFVRKMLVLENFSIKNAVPSNCLTFYQFDESSNNHVDTLFGHSFLIKLIRAPTITDRLRNFITREPETLRIKFE